MSCHGVVEMPDGRLGRRRRLTVEIVFQGTLSIGHAVVIKDHRPYNETFGGQLFEARTQSTAASRVSARQCSGCILRTPRRSDTGTPSNVVESVGQVRDTVADTVTSLADLQLKHDFGSAGCLDVAGHCREELGGVPREPFLLEQHRR